MLRFNFQESFDNEDFLKKINSVCFGLSKKLREKIEKDKIESFTLTDWKNYFKYKAREINPHYISKSSSVTESSIIKSLLNNYSAKDVKKMIDFIWSKDFKEVSLKNIGWWVLKKENADTILQMSLNPSVGEKNSVIKMESNWN